jgi:hypothetical protein
MLRRSLAPKRDFGKGPEGTLSSHSFTSPNSLWISASVALISVSIS